MPENVQWTAVGMRVKTARATAVLLLGPPSGPRVLERIAVPLYDPRVPDSRQPYHVALELPPEKADPVVRAAVRAVEAIAGRAVRELAEKVAGLGRRLGGVGLVIGSDGDPERLSNAHVRAHALEGRLFWKALESAAERLRLPCLTILEREAYESAARALALDAGELKAMVKELGRGVVRPWGAEEKTAALAAWVALTRVGAGRRGKRRASS